MVDIPSQLSFEHMLSHLFPGFFTALTVFMIFDLLTPYDLIQFILKDFNTLISFFGFIFLVGIILGVIIDGFHHRVIELWCFAYFDRKRDKNEKQNGDHEYISTNKIAEHIISQLGCPGNRCEMHSECDIHENRSYGLLKIFYAFNIDNIEKCIALHDYLKKSVYYYYEFYANTSIAMFPFAFVAPVYMVKRFDIDFLTAGIVGVVLIILAVACLDFAWMAYKRWISVLYFSFCRCLKGRTLGEKKEGHSIEFSYK